MRMFWLVFAGLAAWACASASPILVYDTGVCGGANTCSSGLLPDGGYDNNWMYTGFGSSNAASQVTPPLSCTSCNPVLSYVGTDPTSEWLQPEGSGFSFPAGEWYAQTSFDLTGMIASDLELSLNVAADNQLTVVVNGVPVYSPTSTCTDYGNGVTPYCFSQFYAVTLTNAMVGGWLPGLNTIGLMVTNLNDGTATAFRVEASDNFAPEPSTWSLSGIGFAAMFLFRRRLAKL